MLKVKSSMYESFVKSSAFGTFFQSRAFGEFQEKIPYRGKSWRFLAGDDSHRCGRKEDAACLAIRQKLPFRQSWLWVPYGPVGEFREEIFADLARIAAAENSIFARIEPPLNWNADDAVKILKTRWRVRILNESYTPRCTLVLDIDKSAEKILAQMKPKGRYNIKVAQKAGVSVQKLENFDDFDGQDFDEFYKILQKTGGRDGFGIHPKCFYENLLKIFAAKNAACLFVARAPNGRIVGGIIVVFYKDTATYYYGASDYDFRNLMGPYSLQWEAISEARRRGMKFYDFLGIAPQMPQPQQTTAGGHLAAKPHPAAQVKKHPWTGVTDFKKKFGGRTVEYPPAFDIIYKPAMYAALKAAKGIRRIL